MQRWMTTLAALCLVALSVPAFADDAEESMGNPVVIVKTSLGEIQIELYPDKAPITVENFLRYTDEKFFDGTIFHRVIKGFMVQGGGFDAQMQKKPVHEPIKNEANNGVSNDLGTIAMARTNVVDSATAQFFLNTVNNDRLNFKSPDARGYGYCAFGRVIDGMDVVQKIEAVPTGQSGGMGDVPLETITIESVRRKE